MAIPATQIWEVETGGSDTLNSGGFDPANANMATDGAATVATSASPVFTSASYNFVAGDVGAWVYIQAGTNWITGWYKIASVAANAATLSATVGAAVLSVGNVPSSANTAAGCATTASPTGATWSVDYSQQAAVEFSLTGLTTAAANAIILTASATKAMIGNGIQITGGTNFTTGFYSISSVSAGVSITVDRNCTTAAGVAGTAGVGGALASLGKAATVIVQGNYTYIATGTYSVATGITFTNAFGTGYQQITRVIGYGTLRPDTTKATLQASANSITILSLTSDGTSLENIILDGNNQASTVGLLTNGGSLAVVNCKVTNCPGGGIQIGTNFYGAIQSTEITGCATYGVGTPGNPVKIDIFDCYIHDNTATGIDNITTATEFTILNCIIANNGGASSDGISTPIQYTITVIGCSIYNNGRDGVRITNNYNTRVNLQDNILVSNGGFGVNVTSTPGSTYAALNRNNAYYNNTSGARNNIAPGVGDVTLTGVPFTNAAGGDYSLNNVAGQGAACRAAGFPGVFPGGTTTGYLDIGAAQHQDAGGGGSTFVGGGNLTGGMN